MPSGWLAHRIDVDAGACALRVFALQRLRNAAGELDNLEAALHVSMRVFHDLAVLAREKFCQFLLVGFDQPLEFEHHARALLRVGRRPGGLDLLRRIDGLLQECRITQRDLGLDLASGGVPDLVLAGGGGAVADDEMVNLTHGGILSLLASGLGKERLRNQPVTNETALICA